MKSIYKIICLLSAVLMLLALCTGCVNAEADEGSIFSALVMDKNTVSIKGLSAGMSKSEVLSALGLTENDVQESAGGDIFADTPVYFSESGNFPVVRMFTFKDGGLSGAAYSVRYEGAEFDEAYKSAKKLYDAIKKNAPSGGMESGEKAKLASGEAGNGIMTQWAFSNANFAESLYYQDMSASEIFDADLLSLDITVLYK